MTEQTAGPEAPAEGDAPDSVDTAATGDDSGGREAAKYRRKLRDTEAERDQLAGRLAALQRGEAERLAAEHLADGADLWRDGLEIGELLDDDGNVDAAKVAERAKATTEAHPHWTKPRTPRTPKRGSFESGASSAGDRLTPSWQRVLQGGGR